MLKYVLNVVALKIIIVHVKEMQTSEIMFDEITKIYSITVSTKEKSSLTILKKMLDA